MFGLFLILFCALVLLTPWITKHVQGIGYLATGDGQIALILYFLLIFPGVLIHEVSHALTAWILRVRVRHFAVGIRRKANTKQVSLGSVDIAGTDPVRASLIGMAPLFWGCTAILLISDRAFGMQTLTTFDLEQFWYEFARSFTAPDFALWAYLVFAIGNAMLPSSADRRSWGIALLFLAFIGALVYFSGLFDVISNTLGQWLRAGVSRLTYALAVAVAINLVFAVLLFLIERGLGVLGFGRIQYRQ